MGVNIEHTLGGQNQDCFQNAYLMVMPAEKLATTKVKNCENLCFCSSKLNAIHGILIKLNFVANSVVFVI